MLKNSRFGAKPQKNMYRESQKNRHPLYNMFQNNEKVSSGHGTQGDPEMLSSSSMARVRRFRVPTTIRVDFFSNEFKIRKQHYKFGFPKMLKISQIKKALYVVLSLRLQFETWACGGCRQYFKQASFQFHSSVVYRQKNVNHLFTVVFTHSLLCNFTVFGNIPRDIVKESGHTLKEFF